MFIILPEHLPAEVCSNLIDVYKNNKDIVHEWRDTTVIDLQEISNKDDLKKCKYVSRFLNNTTVNFLGLLNYIEMAQIVEWSSGSYQPPHTDDNRESTTFTSVTYLNDDFEGGETYFTTEDLIVKPKVGKTILFNGKKFEHEVKEIGDGIRYTLTFWYSSNVTDVVI